MSQTIQQPVHLACAACGALNRVPRERLAHAPNCGKCKRPLFGGHPVELRSGNFDRVVGSTDIPVVVDFWAAWCAPCKMMAPHFERVASVLEPRIRFAKLDTEAANDIAARYNIRSIPTVIVFRNGQEIDRKSGAMDARTLEGWLRPYA